MLRSLTLSLVLAAPLALCGCPPSDSQTQKAVPNAGATGVLAGSLAAGHRARLKADFTGIVKAINGYTATKGQAPESVYDLVDAGMIGAGAATDPWDNEYMLDGEGGAFSYGADAEPGGEGANADWSSDDLR